MSVSNVALLSRLLVGVEYSEGAELPQMTRLLRQGAVFCGDFVNNCRLTMALGNKKPIIGSPILKWTIANP